MNEETKFDEIRPYRNDEFPQVIDNLIKTAPLDVLVQTILPGVPTEAFKEQFRRITSVEEFQSTIIHIVVSNILKISNTGLSLSGMEKLDKEKAYLFISNHRDIVLDPSLLNLALFQNKFKTAAVAIGDNLLQESWVRDLVKMNKSFIVKRNLPARELILASRLLSEFIFETLHTQHNPVWIAQREGRAKDGDDRTQPGLVNMLSMASKGDYKAYFQSLNIVPLAISYEYDPCDTDKIKSIYHKRFHGEYVKAHGEDSESMKKGILGPKGHVHYHFGIPLNGEIEEKIPDGAHRNVVIDAICGMLDRQIIKGYKLWKPNFIAYDLFLNITPDYQHYSPGDREKFIEEIAQKAATIDGDTEALKMLFYEVNARPVINQRSYEVR